ncbi:MAG: hypothetical protein ACJ8MH_14720 [Povalibacter sp.]
MNDVGTEMYREIEASKFTRAGSTAERGFIRQARLMIYVRYEG